MLNSNKSKAARTIIVAAFALFTATYFGWSIYEAKWSSDPSNCIKMDGLDIADPQPVLVSNPVFIDDIRITEKGGNSLSIKTGENIESVIINALLNSGFNSIEIKFLEPNRGRLPFYNILPINENIGEAAFSDPTTDGDIVYKYSLENRTSENCITLEKYIAENRYFGNDFKLFLYQRGYPDMDIVGALRDRCVAVRRTLGTAPIELLIDSEQRPVLKPFWINPFHALLGNDDHTRNWNTLRIIDTRSTTVIASHYDAQFSSSGTRHVTRPSGCYNEENKHKLLTATIFSTKRKPLIEYPQYKKAKIEPGFTSQY